MPELIRTEDRETAARLNRFNRRWTQRLTLFRRYVPAPWWTPGMVLDPNLRRRYEVYLPIAEFRRDLLALARRMLPHPSWAPQALRASTDGGAAAQLSVMDLWRQLPESLGGRVTFEAHELPALFCALADPCRFGTAPNRYPEQQHVLRHILSAGNYGACCRLLDLGSGTGHGTYEAAALVSACGCSRSTVLGLTREPLEAWMAQHRYLPHAPGRTRSLRALQARVPVRFCAGNILRMPLRGQYDLLLCNGVVGGEFLAQPCQYERMLTEIGRLLAPDGVASFANRFHGGHRARLETFAEQARKQGWRTHGSPELLWLGREPFLFS